MQGRRVTLRITYTLSAELVTLLLLNWACTAVVKSSLVMSTPSGLSTTTTTKKKESVTAELTHILPLFYTHTNIRGKRKRTNKKNLVLGASAARNPP